MQFRYSTHAQLLAALAERLQVATGIKQARLARWALTNLTDKQLEQVTGNKQGKAKLQAKVAKLKAIEDEVGI
jgi:hypothetical protein